MAVFLFGLAGTGCEEISARRAVQEGNKQYEKGNFAQAAQLYEEALQKAPHLDTAHFNAGLTYKKMFRPGIQEPDNVAIAKKAADHFLAYLKVHPKERDIVTLLTRVWNDAGDYESALAYWQRELDKEPKNTEIIGILAGINRQAGHFDKAMEWFLRQVELETDPLAKAGAYKQIGSLMVSRLRGRTHEVLGHERLEIADTGIGMLQKAAALAPDDADVQTALGFLYGERALGQSTTWAQIAEVAAARHHYKRWAELNKKAQQQPADPTKAPGATPDQKPDGAGGASPAPAGDKKEG
ncbi:MAG TPA: tetratricopeptide repeat protein [Haliangium sp.]|nr:tetratricopeptide repeat protein [Haliangium sp.]